MLQFLKKHDDKFEFYSDANFVVLKDWNTTTPAPAKTVTKPVQPVNTGDAEAQTKPTKTPRFV